MGPNPDTTVAAKTGKGSQIRPLQSLVPWGQSHLWESVRIWGSKGGASSAKGSSTLIQKARLPSSVQIWPHRHQRAVTARILPDFRMGLFLRND